MFSYFVKDANCIIVLYDNVVTSTCFNCLEHSSCFAKYGERVPNKDNNKLINKNIPMKLNEHFSEVVDTKDFSKYHKLLQKIQSNTNSTRHKSQNGETHSEDISQTILKKLSDAIDAGAYTGLDPNGLYFKIPIDVNPAEKEEDEIDKSEDKYKPVDWVLDEIFTNPIKLQGMGNIKVTDERNLTENLQVTNRVINNSNATRHKSQQGETHNEESMLYKSPFANIRVNFHIDKELFVKDDFNYLEDVNKYFKNSRFDNYHAYSKEGILISEGAKKHGIIFINSAKETKTEETPKEQNHLSKAINNRLELSKRINEKQIEDYKSMFTKIDKCSPTYFCDDSCRQEVFSRPLDANFRQFDNSAEEIKTEEKDSVINKEELQSYNLYDNPNYLTHLGKKLEGVKHNKHKLPMSKLFVQFPDALQAIVLASCYGNSKYKDDIDWLNFKRVQGGSETYKDASLRHLLGGEKDKESNLPEIFHQAWNKLAELQLWLEENNIDIKDFSENYLKNLNKQYEK